MKFMIKDLCFTDMVISAEKYHTILMHFKLQNVNIITGYKSPNTPFKTFKSMITDLYDKHGSTNAQFTILGDFNLNTIENSSPLDQFLCKELKFRKALEDEVSTTNFNTQIDSIFIQNMKNYHSGTYEFIFSDHKPIFIGISDDNSSSETSVIVDTSRKLENEDSLPSTINPIKKGRKRKSS